MYKKCGVLVGLTLVSFNCLEIKSENTEVDSLHLLPKGHSIPQVHNKRTLQEFL